MLDEVLFIGGMKDGQRICVHECINNYACDSEIDGQPMFYRRVRLTAGKLEISVFVAGLITDEMALKMLVDGYCKEDAK